MFSYKRLERLFQLAFQEEFLTREELTKSLGISERTLRADIATLNDTLKDFSATIATRRGQGYYLTNKEAVKELYQQTSSPYFLESSKDRLQQLLSLFLTSTNWLSLDFLCAQIFVSRTTLLGYLRKLRLTLSHYNLNIVAKTNIGYKIIGSESDIRQCLMEELIDRNFNTYISEFSVKEKMLFQGLHLEEIAKKINRLLPPSHYHLSDYNRKNFVIHVAISCLRVKKQQEITHFSHDFPIDSDIKEAINTLVTELEEDYTLLFSTSEKDWLYVCFFHNALAKINLLENEKTIIFTQNMLQKISFLFEENFLDDRLLKQDLIAHFTGFLLLKKVKKTTKNPLLEQIKKKYPYAYEMASTTLKTDKTANFPSFSEDDIAYVALHLAAAMARKKENAHIKKKTLIICGQGISTSRLIEAILRKRFADTLEIVAVISYASYLNESHKDVDFLISTIPIESEDKPVLLIDFLSLEKGLTAIQKMLEPSNKWESIRPFFEEKCFLRNPKSTTRNALLQEMCAHFQKEHFLPNTFLEKIIEREEISPTNFTKYLAVPHHVDKNITESKILLCISPTPIAWTEEKNVQLIFLLVLSEADKEKIHLFFEWLAEILEDEALQKKLLHAKNLTEFLEFV